MKKILAMILCLVMALSVLAVIPASAATPDGTVVLSKDFKQLYKTNGYTQDTPYAEFLEMHTDLKPIYYQFSSGDVGPGTSRYNLTANGLDMACVYREYAGIVVPNASYKDLTNYCINMTMKTYYAHYAYFSWDHNGEKGVDCNGQPAYTANINVGTNFRHEKNPILMNGGFAQTSGNGSTLRANEVDDQMLTTYSFVVTDGVCKKVVITCNNQEHVFESSTGVVADKNFAFFVRNNAKADGPEAGVCLEKIEVTAGGFVSQLQLADRVVPTEPTKEYEDTAEAKYTPGYVLHNMDFSKVSSFDDTKYFIANNSTPETKVENGVLKVNSVVGSYMLFTGNAIPKNIQDYTVEINFRFTSPDAHSFGYLQSAVLTDKGAVEDVAQTIIKCKDATVEDCTILDANAWTEIANKMKEGKTVTLRYIAMERYTLQLMVECEGTSVTLAKSKGTYADPDSFMGLVFGHETSVEVSNIRVIAGCYGDYDALTWPAEENALVQNVTLAALGMGDNGSNNEDDGADNNEEEVTTAATTTKAAAATTTKAADKAEEKKSGCGSAIAGSAVAVAAILGMAITFSKKRD